MKSWRDLLFNDAEKPQESCKQPYEGEVGKPDPNFDTGGRITYAVLTEMHSDRYGSWEEEVRVRADTVLSDVISSEMPDGTHSPVIDIDFPVRAIPSTTPGHTHLYIDKPITWRQYKRILRALVAAGIVEKGYYGASKGRGGTHARLPWVRKVVAK